MVVVKKGASVGAAAFALGLYLAGPHPVAAADDSKDSSSASENAKSSGSENTRSSAARAGGATRAETTRRTSRAESRSEALPEAPPAATADLPEVPPAATVDLPADPPSDTASSAAPTRTPRASASETAQPELTQPADPGNLDSASASRQVAAVSAVVARDSADPAEAADNPALDLAPQPSSMQAPKADELTVGPVSTSSAVQIALANGPSPATNAGVCAMCMDNAAPAPAPAAPANSLAQVNTAVQNLFTTVSNWLAQLPSNGITDWAEGALLLVRRTLFNQAPTASSIQYATLSDGTIVGRIEVSDAEEDQVTYSVTADPNRGSVAVDSTGLWSYKPNRSYQGSDTFTVTVNQVSSGINVLDPTNPRGLTSTQAAVASTNDGLVTAQYTQGFNVTNLTTRTVKLTGISQPNCWNCSQDGRPMQNAPFIGMQIKPGESMRFEQVFKSFQANMAEVSFEAVNDPYQVSSTTGRWKTHTTVAPGNYLNMNDCDSSGGSCSTNSGASTYYLMDPPGTEVTFAPNDEAARQKMALALNQLCAASAARCSFTPPNGQDLFQDKDVTKGYTAPQARAIFRNGEGNFTFKKTVGQTVTESSSLGVSADASASVFGIVQASVSSNYSSSISRENTFSDEITKEVPPNTTLVISQQYPTIDITGDFDITLGRSTIHLHNVTFTTPDPSRAYITAYDTFKNGDPTIPTIPGMPIDAPGLISPPYLTPNRS